MFKWITMDPKAGSIEEMQNDLIGDIVLGMMYVTVGFCVGAIISPTAYTSVFWIDFFNECLATPWSGWIRLLLIVGLSIVSFWNVFVSIYESFLSLVPDTDPSPVMLERKEAQLRTNAIAGLGLTFLLAVWLFN